MKLVTQQSTYKIIHPTMEQTFESMLRVIYGRSVRIEGQHKNGIEVDNIQDHGYFDSLLLRNLSLIRSDKKHPAHRIKAEDVIPATLEDALTYYRQRRYTITNKQVWVITAQREVW